MFILPLHLPDGLFQKAGSFIKNRKRRRPQVVPGANGKYAATQSQGKWNDLVSGGYT
jgi:hypothetical protein